MKIIKQVLHNLLLSREPIFRVERHRYFKSIEKEFPELSGIYNISNLQYEGPATSKANLRRNLAKVFSELKHAMKTLQTEGLPKMAKVSN